MKEGNKIHNSMQLIKFYDVNARNNVKQIEVFSSVVSFYSH